MKLLLIFLLLTFIAPGGAIRYSKEENEELQKICGIKTINSTYPSEQSKLSGKYVRKIVNGMDVQREEAPWSVFIFMSPNEWCSGTIISPRHILTATHCLNRSDHNTTCDRGNEIWTDFPNSTKIASNLTNVIASKTAKVVALGACKYGTYPTWQQEDALLIEIEEDIHFSEELRPACIPRDRSFEEVKNEIQINGVSDNGNGLLERALRIGYQQIIEKVGDTKFRASDERNIHSVWGGDSGGAGLVHVNQKHIIIGIMSVKSGGTTYLASVGLYSDEICHYTGICP